MPRLIRPHIPVLTRCKVILRQLGEMWIDDVVEAARRARSLQQLFRTRIADLAALLNCEVNDLRLDHDPALGARQKVFDKSGLHVDYIPAANDPEHLIYRPHGAQFERSHLVKTNVRGDHGQHPDRVLIVRNRKLEKRLAAEGSQRRRKPPFLIEKPQRRPRKKWSRPLQGANRWPPKGTQKVNRRRK